jgi:hypothetical protein
MAESTKKSVEERLQLLEAENKTLREENDFNKMKEKYTALLVEGKREVLPHRLTALANAPDDATRTALIEDWPSNAEPEPAVEPRKRPSFSAPARSQSLSEAGRYPSTHDSFVESLQ